MSRKQNTTVQTQNDEIDERELDFISGGAQEFALMEVDPIAKIVPLPIAKLTA